jgi:predicted  nucleic acid-binding Zn-ribbon protein
MSTKDNLEKEIKAIDHKIKALTVQRTLLANKLNNKVLAEQQQELSKEKALSKSHSF